MGKNKPRLTIELVPSSSWQNNLRTILTPKMWKDIRVKVFEKYGNKCMICDRSGNMHAHEVWEYNDEKKTQQLKDIIPLCYYCHGTKHFGYSSLKGNKEIFIKHFMKINNCNRLVFQKHLKEENIKFEDRSKYEWELDINKLKDFE